MTTYFESRHDNGSIAIDDNNINIVLSRSGTVANMGTYVASNRFGARYSVRLLDGECVVAYDVVRDSRVSYMQLYYNGAVMIYLFSSDFDGYSLSNIAQNTMMYIYKVAKHTGVNYGLEVFNSRGETVFHSAYKSLSISKLINAKGVFSTASYASPFGSKYIGEIKENELLCPINSSAYHLPVSMDMGRADFILTYYAFNVVGSNLYLKSYGLIYYAGYTNVDTKSTNALPLYGLRSDAQALIINKDYL